MCWIIDKYVGDCPYNLPVLNNWGSGLSLDYSAGQIKKFLACNPKLHILILSVFCYLLYLYLVFSKLT